MSFLKIFKKKEKPKKPPIKNNIAPKPSYKPKKHYKPPFKLPENVKYANDKPYIIIEDLEKIISLEKEIDEKYRIRGRNYHNSLEGTFNYKTLYESKKQYLKNNPKDFLYVGADIIGTKFYFVKDYKKYNSLSDKDIEYYKLMGEGSYYENHLKDYQKAILIYEKAKELFYKENTKELKQIEEETGAELIGNQKVDARIHITKNKIKREKIKNMEKEAKLIEKEDPVKAIEMYNELNILKPNLKKYNKRIEICKKIIEKKN